MENPIAVSRALAESAHDALLTFLRLELQIASTMLEAAKGTSEDDTRERRRMRANEACAEVVRYLEVAEGRQLLSAREREELVMGLRAVQLRMAA